MLITDTRTLTQTHRELMNSIMSCDNQIDPTILEEDVEPDSVEQQLELISDLEIMHEELEILEQVMSLTGAVDCTCYYSFETKSEKENSDATAISDLAFGAF